MTLVSVQDLLMQAFNEAPVERLESRSRRSPVPAMPHADRKSTL
jgi:hypothetical protein